MVQSKAPIDPLRLKAALALPLTCRLLAKETLPLLYQAARFDIQVYAGQQIYLPQFRRHAQPVDLSFLPRMRSWRFCLECCRTEEGVLVPSLDDNIALMGLMNARGCSPPSKFWVEMQMFEGDEVKHVSGRPRFIVNQLSPAV